MEELGKTPGAFSGMAAAWRSTDSNPIVLDYPCTAIMFCHNADYYPEKGDLNSLPLLYPVGERS
jgi:hypothetical protein